MSDNDLISIHKGEVQSTPEDVKYNPERLIQLDNHFKKLINTGKIQGASYILSRYGKSFACKSMGKLRYDNNELELMPDSIRNTASMSKLFTAVSIMKLVEDGYVYLDQSVSTILKEFDNDYLRGISIKHLLTHSSGLAPDRGYFTEAYPRENDFWKHENYIEKIISGPRYCNPGEAYIYSSCSYIILSEIVTRVSGIFFEDFVKNEILDRLGMNRSFYDVPDDKIKEVSFVSEWEKKNFENKTKPMVKIPRGSGGLFSNLYDLSKFGQMFLNYGEYNNVRILGRKTIEYMMKNHLKPGTKAFAWGSNYTDFTKGLGFTLLLTDNLSEKTVNHEGAGRSALYIDPSEDFIAIYFSISEIGWVPESVINTRSIIWSGIL